MNVKWIIHTVGPIWKGGNHGEEKVLFFCYQNSLLLAEKLNAKSIAFPCISTGVYGFPKEKAAAIALNTIKEVAKMLARLQKITVVCYDKENFDIYNHLLK